MTSFRKVLDKLFWGYAQQANYQFDVQLMIYGRRKVDHTLDVLSENIRHIKKHLQKMSRDNPIEQSRVVELEESLHELERQYDVHLNFQQCYEEALVTQKTIDEFYSSLVGRTISFLRRKYREIFVLPFED